MANGGSTIPSDASPAIESSGGDSLAMYVRGNDSLIYRKIYRPEFDAGPISS